MPRIADTLILTYFLDELIIFVQMYPIRGILCNFVICKLSMGICLHSIISSQHGRRHGFSKTPWTAYAYITLLCVDDGIGVRNQAALVNIYL